MTGNPHQLDSGGAPQPVTPAVRADRPPAAAGTTPPGHEPFFGPFIVAALFCAVGGGFALAAALPAARWAGWAGSVRWTALVQAHGYLQLSGWLGLFVVGMALRLASRFTGKRPVRARLGFAILLPFTLGVLGRAVLLPWLDVGVVRLVAVPCSVLALAGALLAAAVLARILWPARDRTVASPLLLVTAAALPARALLDVAAVFCAPARLPLVDPVLDSAAITVSLFGVVLPAVLGVYLRTGPVFFARPVPSARRGRWPAVVLATAATLSTAAPLLAAGEPWALRAEALGWSLIGAVALIMVRWTGAWRSPSRLRASARDAGQITRVALLWLVAAAVLLLVSASMVVLSGEPPPFVLADLVRHLLGMGVFTTMIVGVGLLLLPWPAIQRQGGRRAAVLTWTLLALLSAATALRAISSLLVHFGASWWPPLMALAGLCGWLAVTLFAVTLLRGRRRMTRASSIPLPPAGPPSGG